MKIVYVCSPYAGETPEAIRANVEMAKQHCRYVIERGCQPVAAHLLYPRILNDNTPGERELGLVFALQLLRFCDELWRFGDHISLGMAREIELATRLRIPIQHH